MVSQKRIPGSADFQALWTIFFHKRCASTSFWYNGLSLSIGYCCLYIALFSTERINSSSIRTDTLAPVTLPWVILASIILSASGCLMATDNINAHRLPSCATSRVELE